MPWLFLAIAHILIEMKPQTIIVLGGGVTQEGNLTDHSKLRADLAINIYRAKNIRHVLLSGKYSFQLEHPPKVTEAQAISNYMVQNGIPKSTLILEEESMDTIGNAWFCKMILKSRNWTNVTLVTSDYHKPRTEYIFDKILGDHYLISIETCPSNNLPPTELIRERAIFSVLKEFLKDVREGDDRQISHMIEHIHPAYARKPQISKPAVLSMVNSKIKELQKDRATQKIS